MMRKRQSPALLALLALVACAQVPDRGDRPARVVEPIASTAPAPRGPALLQRTMIARHNQARAAVGVRPLVWSDALAVSAKAYADTMARTRRFEHADQPMGPGRQGENLFTGTRYAYSYDEMIGYWIAEKKGFVNRPTPTFSRTDRWQDVAHYTQMVWRRSTAVGCAVSSSATDDYLVCRYAPPGNVIGETAY